MPGKLTLNQMAEKFKVGVKTLKRMEEQGYLACVAESADDRILKMRKFLNGRRPLSVEMLLTLLREPGLLDSFGAYHRQARYQVEELGDVASAPPLSYITIIGASQNDPRSLEAMADWLQVLVPTTGQVNYHWVAVRAVWHVPGEKFAQTYTRLPRALTNVRSMPRMVGWSSKVGKDATYFHRPQVFDL